MREGSSLQQFSRCSHKKNGGQKLDDTGRAVACLPRVPQVHSAVVIAGSNRGF